MRTLKTWAAAAGLVALTGAAQAGLVSLGDGTVKDTNTNLIWLQNWNVNGLQNWATQKNWAETTLDGFAGSSDWQLPSINEYNDLFDAYHDLTQVAEFTNVQQSNLYWSRTEIKAGRSALAFPAASHGANLNDESNPLFAVAVRLDDVTASVPEPQTLALALLALGATVVARRRRPA